jgi:hypothetical protein
MLAVEYCACCSASAITGRCGAQDALSHTTQSLLLGEKLLDHEFLSLPGFAGQGKDLRIMLSAGTAIAHAGAYAVMLTDPFSTLRCSRD